MYFVLLEKKFGSRFLTAKYNNSELTDSIQGGPAKVSPTYIFDGNIWMHG